MRHLSSALACIALLTFLPAAQDAHGTSSDRANGTGSVVPDCMEPPAEAPARRLPVPFEANCGQADASVRFLARGRGFSLLLTDKEAVFASRDGSSLRMRVAGGRLSAPPEAEGRLGGVSHYFLGREPQKWHTGIPHYRSIIQRGVLPKTNFRWRGDRGGIEYEIEIGAGLQTRTVPIELRGAKAIEIGEDRSLLARTSWGVLRHSRPRAFQWAPGGPIEVPARFVNSGSGSFAIEAGPCDPTLPVLVDPRVEYSTYLGGTADDVLTTTTTDSSGAVYLVGTTSSTDFPLTSAYQGSLSPGGAGSDGFVTKLSPSGSTLAFSTYFGGNGGDTAYGVAVDTAGAVYVVGQTTSTNFPTMGAIQASLSASDDAFVTKFSSSGAQLVYSTYLGGFSNDYAQSVAVDSSGAAYVAGATASTNFPLSNALQGTPGGGFDAFAAKLNAQGSALAYSTFLGGSGVEIANGISVDANGAAYVVGETNSTNFPLQGAFQVTPGGDYDAFVSKINSSGSALSYSSLAGGSGPDRAKAVAVDGNGVATFVGSTASTGFPTQSPLYGSNSGGFADVFVSRVAASGSSLTFSTFLGGTGGDQAFGVAFDSAGAAYVVGATASTDFPLQSAIQASYGGGSADAFVTKLNPLATALVYSTYLGGSGEDDARGVALVGTDTFVAGRTNSTDFPTQNPFQGSAGGLLDAFMVKVITTPIAPDTLSSMLIAIDAIQVSWADNSSEETGFEVQRRIGAGAWFTLTTVASGTTTFDDLGLLSGTKYTYRVRAFNSDGVSAWSGEATSTTPPTIPGLPLAPSGLAADLVSSVRVDLTWTDESGDETFFQVQRMIGTGPWTVLATPGPNATSYPDIGVLPDRSYFYRVRSANAVGFSEYSETASAVSPGSLDIMLTQGLIKDSMKISRDVLKVWGTLSVNAESPDGAFDPVLDGFELRLGGREGEVLLIVAPAAEGWTVKKGRHVWKTPRGSPTKARVTIDPLSGSWSVSLKRANFPATPANPIVLSLAAKDDAGTVTTIWSPHPRKVGVHKFP